MKLISTINEYFDLICSYISSNDKEKDWIMRDEQVSQISESKKNYIIRHDLDFEECVDLKKVKKSIINNNFKGLTKYEKRTVQSILKYIKKIINTYGMEKLENNKSQIKKKFEYGTIDIKNKKDASMVNKIGDLYGKESITYIQNIFKLEAYVQSLIEYSIDANEKNDLQKLLGRIHRVKNSIPNDVKTHLFIKYANKSIDYPWLNIEFDTAETRKKTMENLEKEYNFILRRNIPSEKIELESLKKAIAKSKEYERNIIEMQNSNQLQIDYPKIDMASMLKELQSIYNTYITLNKEMLVRRLDNTPPQVIDTIDDNKLILVHFMPTPKFFGKKYEAQRIDGYNLEGRIKSSLRLKISKETGKKYSRKTDSTRLKELYKQARNPFDYSNRIPVKIQYMISTNSEADSYVLTKPTTNISMSTFKYGKMKTHLNRKIGIGLLRDGITADNIYAVQSGYNLLNDRNIFGYHNTPISNLINVANETMVDSSKIKIGYIIVVKDTKDFDNSELLKQAKKISQQVGLPLVVYDQYKIEYEYENEIDREER